MDIQLSWRGSYKVSEISHYLGLNPYGVTMGVCSLSLSCVYLLSENTKDNKHKNRAI